MNMDRRGFLGRLFGGAVAVAGGAILAKAAPEKKVPADYNDWARIGSLTATTVPLCASSFGCPEGYEVEINRTKYVLRDIKPRKPKLRGKRRRHG